MPRKIFNLERDVRSTDWIITKIRKHEIYAQNFYAALCNNQYQPKDVWGILSNINWDCSWRYAASLIADIREDDSYIDWYCSGIRDTTSLSDEEFNELTEEQKQDYLEVHAYVTEGVVTDEIRKDFFELGWIVLKREID